MQLFTFKTVVRPRLKTWNRCLAAEAAETWCQAPALLWHCVRCGNCVCTVVKYEILSLWRGCACKKRGKKAQMWRTHSVWWLIQPINHPCQGMYYCSMCHGFSGTKWRGLYNYTNYTIYFPKAMTKTFWISWKFAHFLKLFWFLEILASGVCLLLHICYTWTRFEVVGGCSFASLVFSILLEQF